MQESLVKFVLVLIGLGAVAIGAVFLLIPGGFAEFSQAELSNIGWLRGLGAYVIVMPGLTSLLAAFKRRETTSLIGFSALAMTVATVTLWYAIFAGELTSASRWTVVLPAILGTAAAVFLWASWASRRAAAPRKGDEQPRPNATTASEEELGAVSPEEGP